jgi:asparagine synthase (glutamine-hydrolysing)
MCGIAAIIRSASAPHWTPECRARMDRAVEHLSRRGPDGRGVRSVCHDRALLGHTRLAIQDLSDLAAQPMSTPDGALSLIYNGEIYNAASIREDLRAARRTFSTHSDTEVLLQALDVWGLPETLSRIRGMFSFVAVHERAGVVHVMAAVDPAGMKPLAWTLVNDPESGSSAEGMSLCIASECDALRLLMSRPATLNPDALCRILSIGYSPAPETIWKNVYKLPAGGVLEWNSRVAAVPEITSAWKLPASTDNSVRESSFAPLLQQLAAEHLVGDVPVGMFLSAGLDSTSIGLALADGGADMSRIQAFTLSSDDPADESAEAALVARALGMPHTTIRFSTGDLIPTLRAAAERYDEPQGYTALLTATRIAGAMRQHAPHAKVVLSGDGGDEALGGYAWHRDPATHPLSLAAFQPPTHETLQKHHRLASLVRTPGASTDDRHAALHALGSLSFVHRYLVRVFGGFHPAEARALLSETASTESDDVFAVWLAPTDSPDLPGPRRAQRLDLTAFCPGSINPKLDRACMGVGLELRAPYLDRRMLEWGLSRPVDAAELAPGGGKPSIRAMLARAVEQRRLPPCVLARPKQGFALRTDAAAFEPLHDVIASSRLLRNGILNPRWPSYLTDDPESRRVRLFSLAMLAAWYDVRC